MASHKSVGFKQTTSVSAATAMTGLAPSGTVPATADFVMIQCETQNCRWRDDGTSPTASVGNLLTAGDTLIVRRSQFANFKIIETAASASVNADFRKTG